MDGINGPVLPSDRDKALHEAVKAVVVDQLNEIENGEKTPATADATIADEAEPRQSGEGELAT